MPPTSEVLTLFQSCDTGRQNPSSHLETASKSTVNRPRKRNAHACQQCGKIFDTASHLRDHMISHSDEAAYKCEFCDKMFKYPSSLAQHRRQHTGDLPFKCSHCDKAYPKPSKLEAHLKKNCPNALRNCHICKESFVDIESLKQHLTTHIPPKKPRVVVKRFKCDYCNKLFKFPAHVREHMLIHTGEKPHECHFCGKRFPRKKSLKRHFETHSNQIPPPSGSPPAMNQSDNPRWQSTTIEHTSSPETAGSPDGITYAEQSEAANNMGLVFSDDDESESQDKLPIPEILTFLQSNIEVDPGHQDKIECSSAHQDNVERDPDYQDNIEHDPDYQDDNIERDSDHVPDYQDDNIERDSDHVPDYQENIEHDPDYQDDIECDSDHQESSANLTASHSDFVYQSEGMSRDKKETASKSTANRKRNAHACQQCGKLFDTKPHLRDHMISHSDEAAYQCEFCDKKYKYSCSLAHHRRQHTGNLPFKCSHCDKAYPNPSSLETHLKKNCPNALRSCHICKESFADIESLKQHLTTHIPPKKPRVVVKRFKCDYCNKLFKFPAHVREHVLMHTGEKPHECHFCGMRFPRKKSLKRHFKTHSGEIPPPSGHERSQSAVNQSDNPQLQSTTIQPTSSPDGITHMDQSEATQAPPSSFSNPC